MKRFRTASSLLLALSLVLAGLIGFGAQSAQAVLCNDGTTQASCENNGGPAPTVTAPIAPIVTAPIVPTVTAPIVPTVTAPAPTGPTPPPGGCGINTFWNGNSCAPNPTTTAPTAPTPPPGGCGINTFWNGNSCAPTTGAGAAQTPTIKCADGTFRVTAIECGQVIGGTATTGAGAATGLTPPPAGCGPNNFWNGNSCAPTTGAGATQIPTIKCADGTFRVTAIECGQVIGGTATLPGGTNSGFGSQGQIIQCNDGTGQVSCEKNGGPKPTVGNSGFGGMNNSGVISQSATIKCSDGTFRVTAIECEQSVGGKSTVAITCPSNQVISPSGTYCIYPTSTGTAQGTYRSECAVTPLPASCLVGAPTTFDGATQMAQIATFNPVSTTALKIQGNNAFDAAGVKVGELAKASNGQVFQAAAPPPPPPSTAGGKSAPKKTTKSSAAPVIVMNVLGADNKEILGPDGKPLQTAPIVKQGNFVYTDRNGSPIMATPTLNAAGQAVVHNGKVLMTRLMTVGGNEAMLDSSGKPIMMVPLLGDDGKPLLAPNGEVLYAPPLVNAAGKTMINQFTGQAILARPMADSSGNAALGADKKPFMGQPLLTKDDKLLTIGGQEIYTGAVGMPLTNSKKQQVRTANKQDVQFGFGGTLIDEGGNAVLGPDGKAIVMNANATPLMSNGLPLLDKNGKAVRVNSNGQITDSSGRVILGIDGKAIAIGKSESADVMKIGSILKSTVKAPDGSVAVMALNAQLFDKSGNPIVTDSGQPIFYDAKSKKLIDPKGNAVKVAAGGKIVGKVSSLAFQTVNFAT
jgi:flagellar basal body rod protein FlgG